MTENEDMQSEIGSASMQHSGNWSSFSSRRPLENSIPDLKDEEFADDENITTDADMVKLENRSNTRGRADSVDSVERKDQTLDHGHKLEEAATLGAARTSEISFSGEELGDFKSDSDSSSIQNSGQVSSSSSHRIQEDSIPDLKDEEVIDDGNFNLGSDLFGKESSSDSNELPDDTISTESTSSEKRDLAKELTISTPVARDNQTLPSGSRSLADDELVLVKDEAKSLDMSKSLDLTDLKPKEDDESERNHGSGGESIDQHSHHLQKSLSKEMEVADKLRQSMTEELGTEIISNLNPLALAVSTAAASEEATNESVNPASKTDPPTENAIVSHSLQETQIEASKSSEKQVHAGTQEVMESSVTEYEEMTIDESLFSEEEVIEEEIIDESDEDDGSLNNQSRSNSARSFNSSSSSFQLRFNSEENDKGMIDLDLKNIDIQDAVRQQHFKVIGDLQQLLEETKQQKEAQKMRKAKLLEDVEKAKKEKDEKRSLKEKVLKDLMMSANSLDLLGGSHAESQASGSAVEAQNTLKSAENDGFDEFQDFEDFRVKYGLGEEEMTDILSHLKLCEETNTDVRWDL